MAKKKIKRIKVKRIIFVFLLFLIISFIIYKSITYPIKNIYVINNNIVTDNEVITLAELNDYPAFMLISKKKIEKKLLTNNYIKNVDIKKTYDYKIYIDIKEYKILAIDNNNMLILENGEKIPNTNNILNVPNLISDITDIYDDFVEKFSKINEDVYMSISQIEYVPVAVDKERFLLYMNDNNSVYITLSKIKKMNKYNKICEQLDGKKGIIYLDSGDYVEVKS